ncbi:MAG: DEAD/DEAH box helicase [Desulfobacterales bacterium]|jgi:DEAD/DEAH box helicase domain-containing protein
MVFMDQQPSIIKEYLQSLVKSESLGSQVTFQTVIAEKPPDWSKSAFQWSPEIKNALESLGIRKLYQHQTDAIGVIHKHRHVIVATPTASGKTVVYNLPVLERFQRDVTSRSLYIFPLKALAQDQLRAFKQMADNFGDTKPTAAIYDGDTSAYRRKQIREAPPNVILTNPEMIHLSLLAHHRKWINFFSGLQTVVVDEVHTYRGVFGSHVAQIFRRFHRICRHYHVSPTFVFSSATVANPAQLAEQLTGLHVNAVTVSGAPRGNRHLLFINPEASPAQTAILLLKAALHRNLRTIVYTQSRKLTELIALWAGNKSGEFANRISAYRAGFLAEERRAIEAQLLRGELLAVISTSALELGIDIGDLDLCILVGYPGTVVSTWQRGGRVGRSGQDSALILVAGDDALDQFFMKNPQSLISRAPESAVLNPYNQKILSEHLNCAAAELPLKTNDSMLDEENSRKTVEDLEKNGALLRSADGFEIYSLRKNPHRLVDIRGSGNRFRILATKTGEHRGEIDDSRVFRETHPGAVYLHKGNTYIVDDLDLAARIIKVSKAKVNYYTQVRGFKETEILRIIDRDNVFGTDAYTGIIKVTDQVTEYEMWRIHAKKRINRIPLDLPPLIFETEALWFKIPHDIYSSTESRHMDFMGGIHALEHTAISMFPLLVMVDRNDLGGLSTLFHPQLNSAAVFIYDGIAGGAGLSRQAFKQLADLLKVTLKAIQACTCESGCPSCVQSPKCGSGNRPLDKSAAMFILKRMMRKPEANTDRKVRKDEIGGADSDRAEILKKVPQQPNYGVFDLETQLSAAEVGGWHRADLMKISCAVLYDSKKDRFVDYLENRIPQFIEHLKTFDLVIGFNIKRFDYRVLKGYSNFNFDGLNTLDILEEVKNHLGFRLSLAHLAEVSLGAQKTTDGLQALRWWRQGRILEVIEYCRQDVRITRDLFRYGKKNKYLLFSDRSNQTVRIPVDW